MLLLHFNDVQIHFPHAQTLKYNLVKKLELVITRSSSRSVALLLVPAGGTLASRAGGLRPLWVAFGHMEAPSGRRGAFGSYRWPSATCNPPISQTVIVSDPVQISQIRHGKSPSASQP